MQRTSKALWSPDVRGSSAGRLLAIHIDVKAMSCVHRLSIPAVKPERVSSGRRKRCRRYVILLSRGRHFTASGTRPPCYQKDNQDVSVGRMLARYVTSSMHSCDHADVPDADVPGASLSRYLCSCSKHTRDGWYPSSTMPSDMHVAS